MRKKKRLQYGCGIELQWEKTMNWIPRHALMLSLLDFFFTFIYRISNTINIIRISNNRSLSIHKYFQDLIGVWCCRWKSLLNVSHFISFEICIKINAKNQIRLCLLLLFIIYARGKYLANMFINFKTDLCFRHFSSFYFFVGESARDTKIYLNLYVFLM